MTTRTLRNGDSRDLPIEPGQSMAVVAVSGTYSASVIAGLAAPSTIATNATGGTYGPYATGAVIRLQSSAASEIDFDVDVTPAIVSDTHVLAKTDAATGGIELSAGGIEIPSAGPAFTFAGIPAASLMAGKTVRVTDVGKSGSGSLWISDGTKWTPINGAVLLCSNFGTLAAPLATISASASKFAIPASEMVSGNSIVLPANILSIGQSVRVSAYYMHRGANVGSWDVEARIGTANTSSDKAVTEGYGSAGSKALHQLEEISIVSATSFIDNKVVGFNAETTNVSALQTTTFNIASQMYIGFYCGNMIAGNFIDLISYRVELLA